MRGVGDDKIFWKPAKGKGLAICSCYQILIKSIDDSFPWKPKVPSRVAYFVWTVALGNILTVDNIWKQKILILDCYCMCKRNGELVDHLLIHCPLASDLWSMILTLFGIH